MPKARSSAPTRMYRKSQSDTARRRSSALRWWCSCWGERSRARPAPTLPRRAGPSLAQNARRRLRRSLLCLCSGIGCVMYTLGTIGEYAHCAARFFDPLSIGAKPPQLSLRVYTPLGTMGLRTDVSDICFEKKTNFIRIIVWHLLFTLTKRS